MFESQKILSFIGARAGSKGLKNKNILELAGKPLVVWTIEASLCSKYIDRTIVSTDGRQIAHIARQAGVDVPFLRPAELATDESLLDEAMQHAVRCLKENENRSYDYIMLLQPTSPLRTVTHIDAAIECYFHNKKSSQDILISVTTAPPKAGWLMQKKDSGYIEYCFDQTQRKSRRQELPDYYWPNGAIYFGPTASMLNLSQNILSILPFFMPDDVSADIDSQQDLQKVAKIFDQNGEMARHGKA